MTFRVGEEERCPGVSGDHDAAAAVALTFRSTPTLDAAPLRRRLVIVAVAVAAAGTRRSRGSAQRHSA